ncbi:MAG: signal peptidase I [Chloroflexota bacterium]|nr:signal peptidase I [Chloroflexota bacterium]
MQPAAGPTGAERSAARRGAGCLLEIVETVVLTAVIYLVIHNFVAQPFEVEQNSMVATIQPGDYVLIDKLTPRWDDYSRGDVVVFNPPDGYEQTGVPFIKRVIGLPGETVLLENGVVFIKPAGGVPVRLDEPYLVTGADGTPAPTLPRDAQGTIEWIVPDGHVFVMGDNRPDSQDSRFFGPIERDLIVGRAFVRYFPLDRITLFDSPPYPGLVEALTDDGSVRAHQPRGGSSAITQVSIARS